jgi:DNA-binding CsgD family transcriptional regulator/PAS domain-containing protein
MAPRSGGLSRLSEPGPRRAAPSSPPDVVPSLIGEIYDAALDPSLWRGVLQKTQDYLHGSAAAIFSKDANTKSLNVYYDCGGVDPHYTQLYLHQYAKYDPSTSAHLLAQIEQPISTVDVMTVEEFYKTRFYQEWGRPQGLVDFCAVALEKSATASVMFGVFRQERHGRVDSDTLGRLGQIVPHLRRAMLVGRTIELKTAEAATLADTLDGLSAGMFLIDARGRIVHANASGHDFLAEGATLRTAGGRLMPTHADAARAFDEIPATASSGDAALGRKGIALPLAGRDGERYLAHVLPLTSGARRGAGARYAAVAAVFVRKATIEAPCAPEIIAKHFGLTPTELRVLLAIVQIGGVPETAEALGIGEATVKTHLHRLFCKTGARRQADLVKLVAGFSTLLVS